MGQSGPGAAGAQDVEDRVEDLAERREARNAARLTADKGASLGDQGNASAGMLWLARALAMAERSGDPLLERAVRANLAAWRQRLCPLRAILSHGGVVTSVAFSPDGRRAVIGDWDGTAQVWNLAAGAPLGGPCRHGGVVWAVAFSPDGHTILTGSEDGTARLWDADTGAPRGEPLMHRGPVSAVAFSPDGQTLLTGCTASSARLWQAATGKPIGPPLIHHGWVLALAFTPSSRSFRTCDGEHVGTWVVPGPVDGSAERIALWAQVITGEELDAEGAVLGLDSPAWQQRRRRLEALGGLPPP